MSPSWTTTRFPRLINLFPDTAGTPLLLVPHYTLSNMDHKARFNLEKSQLWDRFLVLKRQEVIRRFSLVCRSDWCSLSGTTDLHLLAHTWLCRLGHWHYITSNYVLWEGYFANSFPAFSTSVDVSGKFLCFLRNCVLCKWFCHGKCNSGYLKVWGSSLLVMTKFTHSILQITDLYLLYTLPTLIYVIM